MSELNPLNMDFSIENQPSYFDPFPSELQTLDEAFDTDTQFTFYTEGILGNFSIADNQATIEHTAERNTIVTETGLGPTIPQAWIEIQIDSGGTGTGSYDNAGVGLVKDENNFLFASWDRKNSYARIQIKIGGSNYFLNTIVQSFSPSYKVAMSIVCNAVCFWLDTGSGWTRITSAHVLSYYDFRTTGNLTGWKWGFTVASQSASTWVFSNFQAGSFGGVGMRDMAIVTDYEGNPYINGTSVFFTATVPEATSEHTTSYCGVFELDMNDYSITQQAVIFIERDGKSYNDLNAHIIRYDNGNRRIFIATWGNDFGGEIKILHKLITSGDILSGVSLISGLTELSLPGLETEDYGAYDPFALYDGDQWLIAYTITEDTNFTDNPFYPALASSEDLSSFDLIGADEDMSGIGYEGTRIIKTNNSYWILAGGPAGSADNARIYDIEMNYRGDLDAVFDGGSVTLPHPMIFAYLDNFYLLTFDDTRYLSLAWTWGQPWIEISNRYQWASGNFFLLF